MDAIFFAESFQKCSSDISASVCSEIHPTSSVRNIHSQKFCEDGSARPHWRIATAVCKNSSYRGMGKGEKERETERKKRLARSHDKNETKGDKVAPRENQLARTHTYTRTHTPPQEQRWVLETGRRLRHSPDFSIFASGAERSQREPRGFLDPAGVYRSLFHTLPESGKAYSTRIAAHK